MLVALCSETKPKLGSLTFFMNSLETTCQLTVRLKKEGINRSPELRNAHCEPIALESERHWQTSFHGILPDPLSA